MTRVLEGSPGREAAIAELGRRVRDEIAAVVPRGARVALLDFPEYGNVGDSIIWLAPAGRASRRRRLGRVRGRRLQL